MVWASAGIKSESRSFAKTLIGKDTYIFIVALFTIAKTWKHPSAHQQTIGLRRYDTLWYTHTHTHTQTGILLNHKKEWNIDIAICSNMDGPRDYHTNWRKSDRERQILYDITYMWNLKNNTNESIYKTDSQTWKTNLWLPKEKWRERGINWGRGLRGTNY